LAPHTAIADVGSVKVAIVTEAEKLCDRFIGSHPMAGTAFNGIAAAELGLFNGRPCVITATDQSDRSALDLVEAVWRSVGAVLYQAEPQSHDRAVALISHLPVFVSASLIQACSQEPDLAVAELAKQLASSGFRDTSRVGGGNPQLGRYMAEYNRSALLSSLKQYQACLQAAIAQIEAEDWQSVESSLTLRQAERSDFLN
jgi:arogenate dehydrogenase (NADP+)